MSEHLKQTLKHFTGSEAVFYQPLFPKYRYTEGVKYLATEANAYWLVTDIFAYQREKTIAAEWFQVWILTVKEDRSAALRVEDGNERVIKPFAIPFTDFPLDEIKLWFTEGTLLLPSEW